MEEKLLFYKANRRQRAGKAIFSIGLVFVISGLAYQIINYPWTVILTEYGVIDTSEEALPDPPPLISSGNKGAAAAYGTNVPDAARLETDPAVNEGIPSQPSFFTARPAIDVQPLGVIKLPKIGVSENIVEGSGDELFYGVGHVRGTAMPGEAGNCVLAGHRNYVIMHPFRYLDKMETGDAVYVKNQQMSLQYEIFKIFVINPEDDWILDPQEEEENLLTLITCTPVLNPTQRLVVWCKLVDQTQLSA